MVAIRSLYPQEIEVYYLLPAIRRGLARALKKQGRDQRTIASWLGVTPAAVSQYLSGKRGREFDLPKDFVAQTEKAARGIKDQASAFAVVQRLMHRASDCRVLCQIHYKMDKSLPKQCALCFAKR
jgi:predicted transcriptional regulator